MPDDEPGDSIEQHPAEQRPSGETIDPPPSPHSPSAQNAKAIPEQSMATEIHGLEDRISGAERWMIWLTGGIVFLTAGIVIVGILQWSAMRGQIAVMSKQVDVAKQGLELQARPWVAPYSVTVVSIPKKGRLSGTVIKTDIRDFGTVPAFHIITEQVSNFAEIDIEKSIDYITTMSDFSCRLADLLGTQGGKNVQFDWPEAPRFRGGPMMPGGKTGPIPIPKELGTYIFPGTSLLAYLDLGWLGFDGAKTGMGRDGPISTDKLLVGVLGCIVYSDQSKVAHHTQFCFVGGPVSQTVPNQELTRCNIHERAD